MDLPDLDRFFLDIDFHSYLVSVTGNRMLMEMYHRLMVLQVRLAMYAALNNAPNSRADDLQQHCAIINALLRENEKDIRDAVILHINHSMIRSLNAIQPGRQRTE